MYKLSIFSRSKLQGVHPDLVSVVERAIQITDVDFRVTEGRRNSERQARLVAAGASRTMRSRHLTGHAVDLAAWIDGTVAWDWPLYHRIAAAMKTASDELGIPIEWGGDWRSFKDGPHFQLSRNKYPDSTDPEA